MPMKMMYGGVPIQSLKVKHFEMDTNSATVQPSDLQAGITCFARGQKLTGTGKSFEFADYGTTTTNIQGFVPSLINIVQITSPEYPIKNLISLIRMKDIDFTAEQTIAVVVVDNIEYPITVSVDGYLLTFNCEKTVTLNYFYGKDNYV